MYVADGTGNLRRRASGAYGDEVGSVNRSGRGSSGVVREGEVGHRVVRSSRQLECWCECASRV